MKRHRVFFGAFKRESFGKIPTKTQSFLPRRWTFLNQQGFAQYEISNYARPEREMFAQSRLLARKGLSWSWAKCILSTVGEHRWQNIADTQTYITETALGDSTRVCEELLGGNDQRIGTRNLWTCEPTTESFALKSCSKQQNSKTWKERVTLKPSVTTFDLPERAVWSPMRSEPYSCDQV